MKDIEAGMSPEDAALRYSITARTIYDWKRIQRDTGSLRPCQVTTGPHPKLASHEQAIRAAVKQNSSITPSEVRETLRPPVCLQTIWDALRARRIVLKTSPEST